jgi:RNA polymerase sigma-70 factor (ECF subfamily)
MATGAILERAAVEKWTDEQVVERVLAGESAAFEVIMRRHNQRLYRVARSILRDDAEAEDVMQDAYVRAYQHLDQFAGRAKFSTWLTRIAVHEALARAKRRSRLDSLEAITGPYGEIAMPNQASANPEAQASEREMNQLLEQTLLALPDQYRTVIMLRDIEEMSTADTAATLEITEENVKVRLHRARALLRREMFARAGASAAMAFPFPATRCDRVVKRVFERLAQL